MGKDRIGAKNALRMEPLEGDAMGPVEITLILFVGAIAALAISGLFVLLRRRQNADN